MGGTLFSNYHFQMGVIVMGFAEDFGQYPDFTTYKQFVMVVCNVTIFNTYRP